MIITSPHSVREYKTRSAAGNPFATKNMIMDRIALILVIIGGINWGSIGLFQFDLVSWIFGGQDALMSRIIYTLVALSALWCISLLFRSREAIEE